MLGAGFQFEWDEFNEGHVWDGHQVTAAEVEEAYYDDEPVFTQNHPPHRASHIMYGYSAAGVLIVAPFGPARRGEGTGGGSPRLGTGNQATTNSTTCC